RRVKTQRPDRGSSSPVRSAWLLLVGGLARGVLAEPLLEPRDAATGVEDLLLARVERVAVRADIGVDRATGSGAPRGERVPAAARHGGDMVLGVNVSLHVTTPVPRAVAGSPPKDGNRYRVIAASSVPDRGTTFPDLEFPLAWPASGSSLRLPASGTEGGLLHLEQELGVALGLAHLLHEQLERLLRLKRVQHPAQLPDDLELLRGEQDLFLPGARRVHVDRREQPLLRELAAQPQLHVAGALELLEDDLVHPGPGLDQGRGQDRQRAAVLDVARRAEEPLRRVQRGGVHATGQDAA